MRVEAPAGEAQSRYIGNSYVYAIGAIGADGKMVAVKIGMSGDVAGRLRAMKCYSWLPLRVLATKDFSGEPMGAVNFEGEAHLFLAKCRMEGEWFEWNDLVHGFIKSRFDKLYPWAD